MQENTIYILLADDDQDDRNFFKDAFEEIKISTNVNVVNDGEELMDYLNQPDIIIPHILFLDLNMPRKNGMECLMEIKQLDHLKNMAIAIYSTSSSEKDIEETFVKGANIYIKKPNDFNELIKTLNIATTFNWQYHTSSLNIDTFFITHLIDLIQQMKFKDLFFSKAILKSLFVIFIFILLFISAITYKNTLNLSNSTNWVMHSYKVHLELNHLLLILKDGETGQRGFLLTHDTIYLKPYKEAKLKVKQSLATLKKLSEDNPLQTKNIDRLSELTELRFGYLRYSMYQDSIGPINKTNFRTSLEKGRLIMDSIRVQSNKIVQLEELYLAKRSKDYKNKLFVTPLLILVISLFSLIVFIVSYIKINKDLLVLENSNKQLIITNESNAHAEKIADFCTWIWYLETEKLTYSNNLYRLLGCEPQSFEATRENFINFIHPEDREKIENDGVNVLEGKEEVLVQFFRIIRKDGQLRYFKSIAKTISDHKGHKTVIGIINDITDQHNANIAIEQRNFELEQTNTELESFNHVASHDLQEPLRKIQIFISRISPQDLDSISETGREYIAKIQQATTRMRTLIDDLLLFSRSNKSDKEFVKTDLNELLLNAKQELAVNIQEKHAVINADDLPVLNVIPYQIQQLFINLINNSLKYSKAKVKPVITIHCEKILVSQISSLKTNPNKEYYKISISDNGMGFDPQFSESIFTLFKRLHNTSDFPGTGIGLAICKRIVENHMGAIKADGKLGIGATFTIFLPQ